MMFTTTKLRTMETRCSVHGVVNTYQEGAIMVTHPTNLGLFTIQLYDGPLHECCNRCLDEAIVKLFADLGVGTITRVEVSDE